MQMDLNLMQMDLNEVNLRFLDFKPIRIGENLDSGEL